MAGFLFVAHDSEDIRPFKTLSSVYLNPLQELLQTNNGSIYQDGSGIILLVDVKTDGTEGWLALEKLLVKYELSGKGGVTILVSGNRDLEAMSSTKNPAAQYDGRLEDLKTHPDLAVISLISAKWTDEFAWDGDDTMPVSELRKLKKIVETAHSQERKVRFWDTDFPNSYHQMEIWKQLLHCGVDFIGTDKLEDLRNFSYSKETTSFLNRSRDSGNQGDAPRR